MRPSGSAKKGRAGAVGLQSRVRTQGLDEKVENTQQVSRRRREGGAGQSSGGEGGGGNWRVGRGANSVHGRAPVLLRRAVLHARRLRQGHGELAARPDALRDDHRHHLARVRRADHELHARAMAGRH